MKVLICTPLRDQPEPLYVASLDALMDWTGRNRPDIELGYAYRRGELLENRNGLVADALIAGADWLLWLDADMTFPADTLGRLLAHGVPFVGCNYVRRDGSAQPIALRSEDGVEMARVWPAASQAEEPALAPVWRLGLGVCLISAEVFRAIGEPWFRITYAPSGAIDIGEDDFLCIDAAAKGIQPQLDPRLSWEVGHVGAGRIHTLAESWERRGSRLAARQRRIQMMLARLPTREDRPPPER